MDQVNPFAPMDLRNVQAYRICQMVGIDQNPFDRTSQQQIEPIIDQRYAIYADQTLRNAICQRPQPRSKSGGKQQGPHS